MTFLRVLGLVRDVLIGSSQGTVQNRRPLHQDDNIEQGDQHAERKRNGDGSRAAGALLLLG